jgi:hypothetical protein
MRSHPATGWFIAFVVTVLVACLSWGSDDTVRATRRSRVWRPEDAGFSLRVPPGWSDWSESRRDGALALVRDPSDPLAGAVAFRVEPDFHGSAGEASLADYVRRLPSEHGRSVVRVEEGAIDGHAVARIEWALETGAAESLRGYELVLDRGNAVLVVDGRARSSEWPDVVDDVAAMMASVRLAAR